MQKNVLIQCMTIEGTLDSSHSSTEKLVVNDIYKIHLAYLKHPRPLLSQTCIP